MPRDGDLPFTRMQVYEPTEKSRKIVRQLAMLGVPQEQIAKKMGIDAKTLRRHYREDLDEGDVEAFASVAGALWHNAVKNNNVVAQIFWMKARHGWIDRREVNHNHSVGPALSHEERLRLLEADPPRLEHPTHKTAIIEGDVVAAERASEAERRAQTPLEHGVEATPPTYPPQADAKAVIDSVITDAELAEEDEDNEEG